MKYATYKECKVYNMEGFEDEEATLAKMDAINEERAIIEEYETLKQKLEREQQFIKYQYNNCDIEVEHINSIKGGLSCEFINPEYLFRRIKDSIEQYGLVIRYNIINEIHCEDGKFIKDDTFIFYPLDENQEQMIIKTIMNIERK